MNKAFCIYPFLHINIDINGNYRFCCQANEAIKEKGANFPYNIHHERIDEVWFSSRMAEYRQKMLDGDFVSPCNVCYKQEQISGTSLRTAINKAYIYNFSCEGLDGLIEKASHMSQSEDFVPRTLHLWPSDKCNFKCRICSPSFSSSIQQDEIHCSFRENLLRKVETSRLSHMAWGESKEALDEVLDFSGDKLKGLVLAGGEPLAMPNFSYLIERAYEATGGDFTLKMHSNGSILYDKHIELFSKIKSIEISLSIDAAGVLNEYIRCNSRWSTICSQIEKYQMMDNVKLQLTPTVCAYNVIGIMDLIEFAQEKHLKMEIENFVRNPPYLSIAVLPKEVLSKVRELYDRHETERGTDISNLKKQVENAIKNNLYHSYYPQFKEFTAALDGSRSQSLKESAPRLYGKLAAIGPDNLPGGVSI